MLCAHLSVPVCISSKRYAAAREDLTRIEHSVAEEVDRAAEEALQSKEANLPPPESANRGVYAS